MRRVLALALLAASASAAPPAPAEKTPAAARAMIERYYAALDARDYRAAYALWGDGGRASGHGYAAFARGFARTRHTRVRAAPPTDGEGAAGSLFITVPVRVDAVLANGTRQRFAGRYVLRRVNDVDGASDAQLRWHIASATLRPIR